MKIKANYTFDASAKQVTFTDYNPVLLNSILLITNVTDNIIIYNFADPAKGGTVATNILTLDYDTTLMDDADKLLIYYDDTAIDNVGALEAGGNIAGIKTNTDDIEVLMTDVVDANNSSAVILVAGATFTGTATDCLQYSSIVINVIASRASANPGCFIDFSSDGTNWDSTISFYVAAASFREFITTPKARYFRVRFTNPAGADQTYFRLQTILRHNPVVEATSTTAGESTYGKNGVIMLGQTTAATVAIPTISGLGASDGIATSYSGFLNYAFQMGFNGTAWDRIRVAPTSKQLRTVSYPDRPTSDLGAAIVFFNHGTVVADWSTDSGTAITQSASYNLWITDLSISCWTDPTAEVDEIAVYVVINDVTDSQVRWMGMMSLPSNGHIHFNTPILIVKGHQYQTQLRLARGTNLDLYATINGYEEA